jgi:hypothetical protein
MATVVKVLEEEPKCAPNDIAPTLSDIIGVAAHSTAVGRNPGDSQSVSSAIF